MTTKTTKMDEEEAPKILPVVGYDPGFGNTKVCLGGKTTMIPSAVSIPRTVGMAAIGFQSAGRGVTIVDVHGHQYAVGAGAGTRGTLRTSMDYLSLTAPDRRALLYGASAQAMLGAGITELHGVNLVIGLPVPLLADAVQAQTVMDSLKQLKGVHEFALINGRTGTQAFVLDIERIKVLAQPAGAYLDYAYNADLKQRPGVGKAEVLVLDLGFNTLDLYVLKSGQVLDRFIGGAEVGVKRLLELLATNGRDLMELDADLRSGALVMTGAQLDSYLAEVLAAVKQVVPELRRFSVVIPCGGGSLVLGDRLQVALERKGATVVVPAEPVAANVMGFWKYGARQA